MGVDTMNKTLTANAILTLLFLALGGPVTAADFSMGNGESNWIIVEGVQRDGGTLTFSEIQIVGDGWLVIHPFEDGAPNGDKYTGATFLKDGKSTNVSIEVYKGLTAGEKMIVMLHSDSNENGIFDFVFVDERNVMDRAVFEGSTMIGHVIPAP
jgi:hypothetical protein